MKMGWYGMAIRSFPEELLPTLQEAFGNKVEEGRLKTDQKRAILMLAVLVAVLVLGLVAYRPF